MDIESDPIKKNKRKEDIETFLGTELEIIDLCDTSSDEDVTREHVSSVTTNVVRIEVGRLKGRR